jgi:hypothetical protein
MSGSSGQPRTGTEGVAAEGGTVKTEARDVVAPSPGGGESPGWGFFCSLLNYLSKYYHHEKLKDSKVSALEEKLVATTWGN